MALNSKRMQTFFNEFLITTTTFLNQFAADCENKFFDLERKLNKIESNLLIIEQKVRKSLENDDCNDLITCLLARISSNRRKDTSPKPARY